MTTVMDTLRDYVYEVIINNRLDEEKQIDTATIRENYLQDAARILAKGLAGVMEGLTKELADVDKQSIVVDDILEEWVEEFKEAIIG